MEIEMIKIFIAQLKTYKPTTYLKRDILGYEALLELSSEQRTSFFELKQTRVFEGNRFKDNIAVLKHMGIEVKDE